MAITAMGIGTKTAPADVNLDPQSQFWSFLTAFVSGAGTDSDHSARAYFSGFRVRQNDPVGMSVLVGGEDGTIDSAAFKQSNTGAIVLLSTDGTPQEVTIATAPASGSRIDAIVSYIDKTNADTSKETAGTPQYVKTIAVQGTAAASNPVAPTNDEITAALPTGVGGFYRWADVKVGQGVINITDDNVSDAKPASPNVYLTNQVNQNKNDISSIQGQVSPWTKVARKELSAGFGKTFYLTRVGNVVICQSEGGDSRPSIGSWGGLKESCPSGYRPTNHDAVVTGILPASGGNIAVWVQKIAPNGGMQQIISGSTAASTDYQGNGMWYTSDAWPS